MSKAGIIAGGGKLPALIAQGMRNAGLEPVFFCSVVGKDKPLELDESETIHYFSLSELAGLTEKLIKEGIEEIVLVGRFPKINFLDITPDKVWSEILSTIPDFQNESVFKALIEHFHRKGIEVASQGKYLTDVLAHPGVIAGKPNGNHLAELDFGYQVAKVVADADIGQMVVVKKKTVIAVEGIDGTNATILRAGNLASETVVVKVSSTKQDWRLDVPTIGLETIQIALQAKVSVIGVEAGKVFFVDKAQCIELANRNGLVIYGYSPNQG